MEEKKVSHTLKNNLFCDIFSDKKNALSLYNAIQRTNYTNENELEIITIKDVIFIGYHNDVSIFFDSKITLWEHQSTLNPNMPLRGLIYYVDCVDGYLEKRNMKHKIYRKTLVKIPAPDYYVLYNGVDDAPDRQELHLSDAFLTPSAGYEWTAKLININVGHSQELLDTCASLKGYSMLVYYMRKSIYSGLSEEEAADKAIERCISEGYLKDYLLQRRGEAKLMLLHFDETDLSNALKIEREEGRKEGLETGRKEGLETGRKEGQEALSDAIERMRAGATREELISEGIDKDTVDFAVKYA